MLIGVALVAVIAVVVVAGAGSDDKESGATASASSSDLVGEAKRIVAAAEDGYVYASGNATFEPSDIKPLTDWQGPASSPEVPSGKHIEIVACVAGSVCEVAAEKMKEAFAKFGWTANITASPDGSTGSYVTLMSTAISKDPDAIVMIAIPEIGLGSQIEQAKDDGIVTVGLAVQDAGPPSYDAYLSNRGGLQMQLLGYAAIADSEGTANTILINIPGIPNLTTPVSQLEEVLEKCADCTTTVVNVPYADSINPVQAQARTTALLNSNPDAEYLIWPFDSFGMGPSIAAARAAGHDDLKVAGKDGNPPGVALVADGTAWLDAVAPLNWAAYAAVDDVRRGIAGEPFLEADEAGIPAHLFNQENSPAKSRTLDDVSAATDPLFDYASQFEELWGVEL